MTRNQRVKRQNGTISARTDHNPFFPPKMAKVKATKLQEWEEYFLSFHTSFWSKNLSNAEQITKLASTLSVMFHLL